MKFFKDCKTLDALKAEYRRLAKVHHPDVGGDLETMQRINAQYDEAVEAIKANTFHADHKRAQREAPAMWRAAVNAVINVPGITIELCGSWVWVTGDTYQHRSIFKAAGYYWSKNKAAWYWHAPEDISMNRRRMTLDEIRAFHGSTLIAQTGSASDRERLEATA